MPRMKPAWWYERQMQERERRDTYFRDRTPPDPATTPVVQKDMTDVYYRSQNLRTGNTATSHGAIRFSVQDAALGELATDVTGLFSETEWTALAPDSRPGLIPRPKGFRPNRVFWGKGIATPERKVTAWQTGYIRYTDGTKSMPLSLKTGEIDTDTIKTLFAAIWTPERKGALLGANNGRAWLELERYPTSVLT